VGRLRRDLDAEIRADFFIELFRFLRRLLRRAFSA
jgi:hypothetical protein